MKYLLILGFLIGMLTQVAFAEDSFNPSEAQVSYLVAKALDSGQSKLKEKGYVFSGHASDIQYDNRGLSSHGELVAIASRLVDFVTFSKRTMVHHGIKATVHKDGVSYTALCDALISSPQAGVLPSGGYLSSGKGAIELADCRVENAKGALVYTPSASEFTSKYEYDPGEGIIEFVINDPKSVKVLGEFWQKKRAPAVEKGTGNDSAHATDAK